MNPYQAKAKGLIQEFKAFALKRQRGRPCSCGRYW